MTGSQFTVYGAIAALEASIRARFPNIRRIYIEARSLGVGDAAVM